MFRRRTIIPDWYESLVADLEAFAASLPADVKRSFKRKRDYVYLDVLPPTKAHRRLTIEGDLAEFEYTLGKLWTEQITPSPEMAQYLLAECDAVRDGRVREVRDLDSGLLHHVYRLKSRGLHRFVRDGEYAFSGWFGRRVERVKVTRLPALEHGLR